MKKIHSIIVGVLISGLANAQSATLINPMTNVEATAATLTSAGEMVAEWPVANLTNASISIKCLREELNLVPGTQNYFCWGVCYGETTNVSVLAQTIAAGDTNDTFYAHYKPLGNVGQSDINYCFFNTADPNDRACHTVHYCFECIVDIEDVHSSELNEFFGENPLIGLGNYSYNLAGNEGLFQIRTQDGKLVKSVNLNGSFGTILLNSSDFTSGIYFVTIESNNNSSTTKLVIQ
jgi:hypothetical protein